MCAHADGRHQETIFQAKRAAAAIFGGDIYTDKQKQVRLFGARLQGSSADAGGSLCMRENSSISMCNSQLVGASASTSGGCVVIFDNSTLLMTDSKLSGCNSPAWSGGAVAAMGRACVTLLRSNITNSTAGTLNVVGGGGGGGGGVDASGTASVTLTDSQVTGNVEKYGAGLMISENATLKLLGSAAVSGNTAWKAGGGVVIASDASIVDDLGAFLTNNSARLGRNTYFDPRSIAIVGSSNNTNEFIPSSDSQGGLLHVTLNVTGPHDVPSDADIMMTFVDSSDGTRFTQIVPGTSSGRSTRDVVVKIRQPPGARGR